MLQPKYWLRERRLRRALVSYRIYDPPHKVEERVLPKEKALENFQYFMRVREERVRFFIDWLSHEFGTEASIDQVGIENILDWAGNYIPIIMPSHDRRQTADVYHCYAEPWTGEYAGANAFFDLGAMLGEAIISRHPNLRWQMEWSLSDYKIVQEASSEKTMTILRCREREIREAKREKWSEYRRPIVASASDPIVYEPIYEILDTYFGLVRQDITMKSAVKNATVPEGLRSGRQSYLRDWFRST